MYRHIEGVYRSGPRRDASLSGRSFGSVESGCQVRGAQRPAASSRRVDTRSGGGLAQCRASFSGCQHLRDGGLAIAQRIERRFDGHVEFPVCIVRTPSGGVTVQE